MGITMSEENLKEKIIIECPNKECRQKLGIPKTIDTLRVSCPRCGTSFLYPTQKIYKKKTSNRIKNHPIFFGLIITLCFLLLANRYLIGVLDLNNIFLIIGICFVLWFIGTWVMDKFKEKDTKWYYHKWFVILILLIFSPLGITLLWAGSKFKKPWKVILTILFGSWFVFSVLAYQPGKFLYSSKDEIVKLFSTQKEDIHLKLANYYVKDNFREVILSNKISSLNIPFTIPQIVKKWNDSIILVKSIDKNGNVLGQGSGFVISEDGAFITNYHVVESAYNVLIQFINGKSFKEISLISAYPYYDIAILNIEEENELFLPVILGDSDNIQVGEQILAIGNPYGWENTISDGLISGMREIDGFKLLQITAPVSPGSSGGALFNMKGEVIGITTIGSQWGAQNLNFAIPINTLKLLIREKI
jgi:hypothetical protein